MAKKRKTDQIEDVHFRVDENERRLHGLEKILALPEPAPRAKSADLAEDAHLRADEHDRRISAIEHVLSPQNMVALVMALSKAIHEDAESDKAVSESNREVSDRLARVADSLEHLMQVLLKPTIRTAVLDLPSGAATMTVHETRQ